MAKVYIAEYFTGQGNTSVFSTLEGAKAYITKAVTAFLKDAGRGEPNIVWEEPFNSYCNIPDQGVGTGSNGKPCALVEAISITELELDVNYGSVPD